MNKIEFKQFLQNTKDNIQEKLNPKKIGTKISVSLKSKKTRKNLIIYAFLTLFCIAFLLLLSASTSPLYKDLCDGDSSIFIFFGKAITLGKVNLVNFKFLLLRRCNNRCIFGKI